MNVYIIGYLNNWRSNANVGGDTLFDIVNDCSSTFISSKWIFPYQFIIDIIRNKFDDISDDVIIRSINNSDVGKYISNKYNVHLDLVYVNGLGTRNSTVIDFPSKVIGYSYINEKKY